MGQNDQNDYGYFDESDPRLRDFYDSLSAEQKTKLKDLQDKHRDFVDNLTKDQQDLWSHHSELMKRKELQFK